MSTVSPLDTTTVALVKGWLGGGAQLPAWQAAQVVVAASGGTPASMINDPAGHLQVCITGGTTGATIPNFNDAGGTTNDNGVVWQDGGISQDQNIQECITAWGMQLLIFCGLGDQNNDIPGSQLPQWAANLLVNQGYSIVDPAGHQQTAVSAQGQTGATIPTFNDAGGETVDGGVTWEDQGLALASPFNTPVTYEEVYDGNGSDVLYLRNRPVRSITSLVIGTLTIPQSTSFTQAGWVIRGDGKSIALRNGGGGAGVSTSQFYPSGYGRRNFWQGVQNVFITYTAGYTQTPADLQFMSTRVVALSYKQRQSIGQKSQAMAAGAGTVTFDWRIDDKDWLTIVQYKRASC
jgi:hypothetical protein